MKHRILYLFTRTPLHVGAGASVGAIDQPIQRERHTGFPIIPASSLKGTFADQWPTTLRNDKGEPVRLTTKKDGEKTVVDEVMDAAWLFGSDDANVSFAGALQFGEARLLAFPVRSAKGSFAWLTCPLILRRAARDGVLEAKNVPTAKLADDEAILCSGSAVCLPTDQVVLEEYTFTKAGGDAKDVAVALADLLKDDKGSTDLVWQEVSSRLVILSDGMMSFFAQNACEVAQHVRIDDDTGTAADQALFNQENVPSETMFYAGVRFFNGRGEKFKDKTTEDACGEFSKKLAAQVFQFGGDASTGLGYCSVKLSNLSQEGAK